MSIDKDFVSQSLAVDTDKKIHRMNAGTSLGVYYPEEIMNRTQISHKHRKKRFKPFINIDSTHFETNVSHKDEKFGDISMSRPQTIQRALHPID